MALLLILLPLLFAIATTAAILKSPVIAFIGTLPIFDRQLYI
jgi:hypothetical protein